MKRKIILIILMFVGVLSVGAQGVAPVQLRELLREGLEHNYVLQITRGEQQQRENNATRANAGFLPTADLTGSYDFYLNGTSLTYSVYPYDSTYVDRNNAWDANVGLDWTIFDGFYIRTNYERLKELEGQSRVSTRIAVEDYIASFAAEYFMNIMERKRLDNLRSAVALSSERLRIVRARYNVGNFSRLDVIQARVDFNADSADYIKQQEVLYTSSVNLSKMLVADDLDKHIDIVDSLIVVDTTLRREVLYAQLLENNSELLYADRNSSIAELDYKMVASRNYPYVKFNADYGIDYTTYSRTNTKSNRGLDFTTGLTIGFDLFDPTRKSARKNAQITIDNARLSRQDVELELKAQFTTLWQAYVNNIKLLNLESVSLYVAQENFDIAMERYLLGDLSGIEMREAQKSLLDAEDRILQATYNTKICEISLLQISGSISVYL